MLNRKSHIILVAFSLLTVLMFQGCTKNVSFAKIINNSKKITDKKMIDLSNRHLEYWNYFSQKKFSKSYQYELPYQRFLYPLTWYQKFNKDNDSGYIIEQLGIVRIDEDSAVVKSKYVSKDGRDTFLFDDKWFLIDGKWYHVMRTSKVPLPIDE